MMRLKAVLAASTILLGLGTAQALAQDYTLAPLDGQTKLGDGFTPDPFYVDVIAGGTIDGMTVADGCNGFITDAPTYRVFYTAGANALTFTIQAEDDATLIISDPEGNWVCNDDGENFDPLLTFDAPLDGQYDIWVGTYAQVGDEGVPATLVITADAAVLGPEPGVAALDYTLDPLFGTVDLVTGFTPDPQVFDVTAGGPADAYTVSESCWGYTTAEPTYRLNYTAGDTFPLFIAAYVGETGEDLVLVVSDPEGNWVCDDDSAGNLNPMVRFDAPLSGQYDIWVGTYGDIGEPVDAALHITEVEPAVAEGESPSGILNWNLTPAFGEQDLIGGFGEPVEIPVTTGGDVAIADLENGIGICTGFTTEGPAYRIYYTVGDPIMNLTFTVTGDTDTTLVVADPAGDFYCDDDSAGDLNPQLVFDPAYDGVYDIWIGTYGAATEADVTLTIAEAVAVNPYEPPFDSSSGSGSVPPEPTGELDYNLDPLFGTIELTNGFLPDPAEVAVTAGGDISAYDAVGDMCRGYATAEPTYRLNYVAGSFPLAIYVEADADTTLIISDPEGNWICDDDSAEGLNPAIFLESPLSGQYDIWVGTYGEELADATLLISETVNPVETFEPTPSVPPPSVPAPSGDAAALDPAAAPTYEAVVLAAGFSPDPTNVAITAGGTTAAIDAVPDNEGTCRGYVATAPDVTLDYAAGDWPLHIGALSEADTTLVILGPDGTWYCDDDSGDGLNPVISFLEPAAGLYAIWVGTYLSGTPQAATLTISEVVGPTP